MLLLFSNSVWKTWIKCSNNICRQKRRAGMSPQWRGLAWETSPFTSSSWEILWMTARQQRLRTEACVKNRKLRRSGPLFLSATAAWGDGGAKHSLWLTLRVPSGQILLHSQNEMHLFCSWSSHEFSQQSFLNEALRLLASVTVKEFRIWAATQSSYVIICVFWNHLKTEFLFLTFERYF